MKDLIEKFEKLGFSKYATIRNKKNDEVYYIMNHEYGVSVELKNNLYKLSGGNLMYFGSITFPEMSNRPIKDIEKQVNAMSYYVGMLERYPYK